MIFWNPVFAQSKWVSGVSEDLGTFEKNYLYPSVLRALNVDRSVEFNRLIEDIRYLRILRIDSSFIVKHQTIIEEAESKLTEESFESIAQMKSPDGSTKTLYIKKENDRVVDFLAFIRDEDSLLIIEIVGELQVKSIRNLMNIDYNNFNEFVGLDLGL